MIRLKGKQWMAALLVVCVPMGMASCSQETVVTNEGPSDSQVLAQYEDAREAFLWFATDSAMPFDYDAPRTSQGRTYYPVTHESIQTMQKLRVRLERLFAPALVESLLDTGYYIDLGGKLYTTGEQRGGSPARVRPQMPELERQLDGSVLVHVAVEFTEGAGADSKVTQRENYVFPYRQVSGKWVFTEFDVFL